ncbi:phosphopantetheine-binding protein [Dactylosporangium darangshiense]|uniref:phosphopantetheine-binding protein n=1 Tax=Dactylosporangium darangshiense TaxID=579108 RepID=UPI00362725E4
MIPTHYIHLTTLPRTPNGKIDRNALPTPDTTRPDLTTTYQPPTTPTEQHLTTIWTDLLDLDHIGIGDDFFNLGGHSLLAIQVLTRTQAHGYDLSLAELFDHPTIAALAALIDSRAPAAAPS